jgi:hypothetical protein
MTPKEKAFELYKMYNNIIIDEVIEMKITYLLMTNKMAKKAALIAVNEIIKRSTSINTMPPNYQKIDENTKEYWVEVKNEIEKL